MFGPPRFTSIYMYLLRHTEQFGVAAIPKTCIRKYHGWDLIAVVIFLSTYSQIPGQHIDCTTATLHNSLRTDHPTVGRYTVRATDSVVKQTINIYSKKKHGLQNTNEPQLFCSVHFKFSVVQANRR